MHASFGSNKLLFSESGKLGVFQGFRVQQDNWRGPMKGGHTAAFLLGISRAARATALRGLENVSFCMIESSN